MHLASTAVFIALYGLSYGMLLFCISVGLVIVLGLMRVVNLAHGAFAALGGYLAVSLMAQFGLPFAAAVVVAVAVVVALSVSIERLFFLPLYKASELDQVLLTIGLMFIAAASFNLFFGPDVVTAPLPPWLGAEVHLAGQPMQIYRIVVIGLGAVLIAGLLFLFEGTSFGAQLRAAVDNRTMAQMTGINVPRLFTIAFALGSGLAAFGAAIGFAILPLEPLYPFKYLTLVLIVAVLSGLGNIRNAAIISVAAATVDTAGRLFLPSYGGLLIYLLLVTLLMWRERGLLLRRIAA